MRVSIICPTVTGREESLARTHAAYCRYTSDFEFIVIKDLPTCGHAWNAGYKEATGDYIHLTADDIEPFSPWAEIGVASVEAGFLPCARVLNSDGSLQSCGNNPDEVPDGTPSDLARIPFMSREQAEAIFPILEIHYATDYWVSHRGAQAGWPTVVVREFCFYHHFAQAGRLDERLMDDMRTFWRAARLPGKPMPAGLSA